MATKVKLVSRAPRAVTVELPDGTRRVFPGKDVVMVYCNKGDLDDAIAGKPNPQTSLDCTVQENGELWVFGTANYI